MMMDDYSGDKILVSACLLGVNCRYDGGNAESPELLEGENKNFIPVCPEQMGGLPTPREPCEIAGGAGMEVLAGEARVLGKETGTDFSENFIRGAEETLKLARISGCKRAVFKANSPSCGRGRIHRGEELIEGDGVAAALLLENGIEVIAL